MRKFTFLFIVFIALLGTGCAEVVVRSYEGQPRQLNEVAMLHGLYFMVCVWPTSIDGKLTHNNTWYELLPGKHTVGWLYGNSQGNKLMTAHGYADFIAHAGHVYELHAGDVYELHAGDVYELQYQQTRVQVFVVDITDTPTGSKAWRARGD
jgi:hypothetical protein